jgi:DNA-binding NtrC family response regulator
MSRSTALLITRDNSLAETVGRLIETVPLLGFQRVDTFEEAGSLAQNTGVVLLLPHLAQESDTADVARLLRAVMQAGRLIHTIVISDLPQGEPVQALLRLGATDCLERPLDQQRFAQILELTLTPRAAPTPTARDTKPLPAPTLVELNQFLYACASIRQLTDQIYRVAPQETTILLTGETGTGKTQLARVIHDLSPRRREPLQVVNCGAIPPTLIESEMFGHVKGAFTGANNDRNGKFYDAGGGTLLLDEIDALSTELQAKLLRVVEERVFEPVGSNRSYAMQARLIVASNRDLEAEVAAGRFRSDIYYRLNVVSFHLPPLRDRREVIPRLIRQFLSEFVMRNGREIDGIAPPAMEALCTYHWPGNVRELRNAIERAVALCPAQEIQLEDLPASICQVRGETGRLAAEGTTGSSPLSPFKTLSQIKEQAEVARILKVLHSCNNNRQRAAAILGISRMTLYNKMHKYGLLDPQGDKSPPAEDK